MAKAVRRCFKADGANWLVGKMCNPKGASKKYASGVADKKKKLGATRRQMEAFARGEKIKVSKIGKGKRTRKDGKRDKRFK